MSAPQQGARPKPGDDRINGALFRAYMAGLEALGLRREVRAQVSERVRQLMEQPPLHTAWLPGSELVEIFDAVVRERGLEGVRQLGYEATRRFTAKLLQPFMQSVRSVQAGGPEVLFRNTDTICRPLFRGLRFTYMPETPRSGTLELRSTYRMAAPAFAAWEGSLCIIFDECGVEGTISPSSISADGRVGTMKVSW
jgi:hypothetical protein